MDGFTLLAFGFCAALTLNGNQDVVALGYTSAGQCIVHMHAGDSHGETVTINGRGMRHMPRSVSALDVM